MMSSIFTRSHQPARELSYKCTYTTWIIGIFIALKLGFWLYSINAFQDFMRRREIFPICEKTIHIMQSHFVYFVRSVSTTRHKSCINKIEIHAGGSIA